jgi:hypothetical protein
MKEKNWEEIPDGATVLLGLIQIDIAGSSQIRARSQILMDAKLIFCEQLRIIAEARGGQKFRWDGDGGVFMFLIQDGTGCDTLAFTAMQMLNSMAGINEEINIRTELGTVFHVRISADQGVATYHKNPSHITAKYINDFLKNERDVSMIDSVTLTGRVWEELSPRLQTRFRLVRKEEKVNSNLYTYYSPISQSQDEIALIRQQCVNENVLVRQQGRDELDLLRKQVHERFMRRTEAQHNFAHNARNLCVKLMPRKPEPPTHPPGGSPVPLTGRSHYAYKEDFVGLLESLADVFSELLPFGTRVWACIRERRSDDHYHTWVRSSRCNPTRREFSRPLHKESKTVVSLKESYEKRMDCVIVTSSRNDDWTLTINDQFNENLSVLMGAVLSKSYNPANDKFDAPKLNWILCVNADAIGVFDRSHIPLMKTCNDIFSWILNSFIRYDAVQTGLTSEATGEIDESMT